MGYSIIRKIRLSLILIISLILIQLAPTYAMSTQEEVKIGKEGAEKIEKKFGIRNERKYAYRIDIVGQRIAAVSPRKDIKYHFKTLNTPKFNALAFPGGYIYATAGLMDQLNDGELAFVLGHEIAHVTHKHAITQAEKNILTTLGIFAITAAVNKGKINEGSANTALVLSYIMSNQYSQADERTADADGVKYMAQAGYDPKYAVSAMEKLRKSGGGDLGVLNTFLGSHPLASERINSVRSEGQKLGFKPSPNNPPILTGKDYENGNSEKVADSNTENKRISSDETKTGFPTKRSSIGGSNREVIVRNNEPTSREMKVDYSRISESDLKNGTALINWEAEIRKSLVEAKGNLVLDERLAEEASRLASERIQPVISNERIIWVELLDKNTSLVEFMSHFRKESIPRILSRRSDFSRMGVAVTKNGQDFVHIIVILK